MTRVGDAVGWGLPKLLLRTRGVFLGETDEVIDRIAWWRSALGVLGLMGAALWWPDFARDQPNQFAGPAGHSNAFYAGNFALNWAVGIVAAVVISGFYLLLVSLVLLAVTKSRARLVVLRHLGLPVSALAALAGFLAADAGVTVLTGHLRTWAHTQSLPVRALLYVLVFVLLTTCLVWTVKAFYFAAVDVFRAGDGHPLLAPLVTTALVWTMAAIALVEGGAQGVPGDIGLVLTLAGPVTVTLLNLVACVRLHRRWGTLLFRDGPPGRP